MSGGPTKSWCLNWTADHLWDADAKIKAKAEQFAKEFAGHLKQADAPGGTQFSGQLHNSAVDQAQAGVDVSKQLAGIKDQASTVVTDAAHEGQARQRMVANAIGAAERDGYMVLEDISQEPCVLDTKPCSNKSESDHRALAAETHSRTIKQYAGELWATDQGVETKLTALATQMQNHQFPAPGAPGAPDVSTKGKPDSAPTTAASVGALDDTVGKINSGALLPKSPLDSGYYDMSTPEGRAMAAKARQLLIDNGKSPADADKLIKVLTTPSPAGSAEKNAPPTRAPGPQSGSEAFGEQWDQTERGIRSLLGQNGGDATKDAWTSLIEGANKTMNPALQGLDAPDTAKALLSEGQLAVDNPRAFAGKHALDAAALIAGGPIGAEGLGALGEGRLALGADDLAGAHGLHDVPAAPHTADVLPPSGDHLPVSGDVGHHVPPPTASQPPAPLTFDPNGPVNYASGDPHHPGGWPPGTPDATWTKGDTDPGWKYINHNSDKDWMPYQQQVGGIERTPSGALPEWIQHDPDTGAPVAFDGHTYRGPQEVFLEAKDGFRGMAFAPDNSYWTGRAQQALEQVDRQLGALPQGARLEWHVSDPYGAAALEKLFADRQIYDVDVIYTPKAP